MTIAIMVSVSFAVSYGWDCLLGNLDKISFLNFLLLKASPEKSEQIELYYLVQIALKGAKTVKNQQTASSN